MMQADGMESLVWLEFKLSTGSRGSDALAVCARLMHITCEVERRREKGCPLVVGATGKKSRTLR